MLTGTETRPKEIVAVPIERAGMGRGGKREAGRGKREEGRGKRKKLAWDGPTIYSWCITKISNVDNSGYRILIYVPEGRNS
jgi:hypothetical protein